MSYFRLYPRHRYMKDRHIRRLRSAASLL